MAKGKEIRLRARVDDAGIPIDLKKVENTIVSAFDRAGKRAAAAFVKNASGIYERAPVTTPGGLSMAMYSRARGGAGSPIAASAMISNTQAGSLSNVQSILARIDKSAKIAAGSVSGIGSQFVKLAGVLYSMQFAGGLIDRYLISPIMRLGRALFDVSDEYRKFITALSGPTGSFGRASGVARQLFQSAGGSVLTSDELRQAARVAAFSPSLNGRFGVAPAKEIAKQTEQIGSILARLVQLSPEQDAGTAGISLKELISGDARSLRLRFEIDPDDVARSIGKPLREVLGDPDLAVSALDKFLGEVIGSGFEGRSGLLSNATAKLQDTFSRVLIEAADGSLYDGVVDRLRGLNSAVASYLDTPAWRKNAERIGSSFLKVLDAAGSAVLQIIGKLSGSRTNLDSIESVADAIAGASESIANLAGSLPDLAAGVASGARELFGALIEIPSALQRVASEIRGFDPVDRTLKGVGNKGVGLTSWFYSLVSGVDTNAIPSSILNTVDTMRGNAPTTQPSNPYGPNATAGLAFADFGKRFAAERSVRQDVERMLITQNQRTITNSAIGELSRTSLDFDVEQSQFEKVLSRVDTLFDRLDRLKSSYAGLRENAIANLQQVEIARGDKGYRDRLTAAGVNGVEQERLFDSLESEYRSRLVAVEQLPKRLQTQLQRVAGAMASGLGDLPAQAAGLFADRINNGLRDVADSVSRALQLPDDIRQSLRDAITNAPLELQQLIGKSVLDAKVRAVQQAGEIGRLDPSLPFSALLARGPIDQQSAFAGELDARQQGQGKLAELYGSAQAAYRETGSDADLLTLTKVGEQALVNQQQIIRLRVETSGLLSIMRDVGVAGREALQDGLGSAISGLIRGTSSLRESFVQLGNAIVDAFSDAIAQQFVRTLIGGAFQGSTNGGYGAGGGLFGNLLSGLSGAGGATPYASGGLVSRPQLALIGERADRVPEAVVPMLGSGGRLPLGMSGSGDLFARLPGGRSIPAVIDRPMLRFAEGGVTGLSRGIYTPDRGTYDVGRNGGSTGDTFIVGSFDEAIRNGFVRHKDTMISVLSGDISRGGKLSKATRR